MKYLLSILLFISLKSESQITITKVTSSGELTCSGSGIVTITHNNIPFTINKLYIAVVFADSTDTYGSNITSTSFTWDTLAQIKGVNGRRIAVYKMLATSSTTTDDPTETFTFGHFPNMLAFYIYEVAGIALGSNGGNAVIQVAIDSATGANPTISTLSGIAANTGVIAAYINGSATFSGTPESGFTESVDNGCNTGGGVYIAGNYLMYRVNTNDNTPTVTASSSNWIGLAISFRGGRRIISTN